MTTQQTRIAIGAIAAGAVAVVGYLALNAVITPEIALAINAVIAAVAGYIGPKTS